MGELLALDDLRGDAGVVGEFQSAGCGLLEITSAISACKLAGRDLFDQIPSVVPPPEMSTTDSAERVVGFDWRHAVTTRT